jgi:ubiquinone/menaquinone biosynthesis C-methylase UbiE
MTLKINMYNKKYVETWIKDSESGAETFRAEHFQPFLKEELKKASPNAKVLDVGCGWGMVIPCLCEGQEYVGLDIATDFFPYIKGRYDFGSITLVEGGFPGPFPVKKESVDMVICSASIHTVKDLITSLASIYSVLKKSGILILIDFSDAAFEILKSEFDSKPVGRYLKGDFTLMSKNVVNLEAYFHREKEYEKELGIFSSFSKKRFEPLFVGYVAKK